MSNTYKLSVNHANTYDLTESDLKNLDAVSVEKDKFHVLKTKTLMSSYYRFVMAYGSKMRSYGLRHKLEEESK
jgi:hypothetical protein